jgi:hypothetical protein
VAIRRTCFLVTPPKVCKINVVPTNPLLAATA